MTPHRWFLAVLLTLSCGALVGLPAATARTKKSTKPAFRVIGFGIDQLYIPRGKTVKGVRACSEMVGSNSPVGPPQMDYLVVYVRARHIKGSARSRFKDTLPPGDDEVASAKFSAPGAFHRLFAKGGFPGGGSPADTRDVYHLLIVGSNDANGPDARQFDGDYSFTGAVKAGGHTLLSKASIKVRC